MSRPAKYSKELKRKILVMKKKYSSRFISIELGIPFNTVVTIVNYASRLRNSKKYYIKNRERILVKMREYNKRYKERKTAPVTQVVM